MKNQENYYKGSKGNVIYHKHFVTENSVEFLGETIEKNYTSNKENNISIVGLHACADLSITILDIFLKLNDVKSLIMMPCCYHRLTLKLNDDNSETFHNFPKSSLFKRLFLKYNANCFIKRPFLRNACQYSNGKILDMSEKEHDLHAKNMLFRAILQEVANESKYN